METLTATGATKRPDNVLIRASAGTGKTHQLSTRFLELLVLDQPVDRILATTFTRKAAGEIFDRIVFRLIEAIDDDAKRQQLAKSLHLSTLDRDRCMKLLDQFTRQLHRCRVVTIDAFFAELSRSFALDLTLPTNWQIADESWEDSIRGRAIERLLRQRGREASIELVHLLAKGETKRGIDRLINDTVKELFETYREAKPAGSAAWNWITVGSNAEDAEFNAAILDLQTATATAGKRLAAGLRPIIEFAQAGHWEDLAKTTLARRVVLHQPYYGKMLEPKIEEPICCLLRRATFMIRVRMKYQLEACYQLLRDYERHYRDVCREMQIAFFTDIPDALRALDDRRQVLAYRLDSRLDHLLLDEFQDTSAGQWSILRGLADRVVAGDRSSLFCVGDVKQAIYAWRNGTSDILDSLDQRHGTLTASVLNASRRSRAAVISAVNQIFRGIRQHGEWTQHLPTIERWTAEFPEHSIATKSDTAGYACLRSSAHSDDLKEATYQRTAEVVSERWQAAPQFRIAVLVRTNSAVGRIMHHLRALGVNASEDGGNPLTNSTAVRIILSLMRLADHPYHSAARFHVAHSPLASKLGMSAEDWHDLGAGLRAAQRLRHDLLTLGYGATVAAYANELAKSCNRLQEKRLQQLVDLAYVFQRRATTRPTDFVNFVNLRRVADPTAANIHVMTVHQAKGLEFDRVVVTELEKEPKQNKFVYDRDPETFCPARISPLIARDILAAMPQAMRAVAESDRDRRFREELCVLYVAMTRAKYELQIVVAPTRPTKHNKSSWPKNMAGLVRAALCDTPQLAPDQLAFETGDPHWYREVGRADSDSAVADHVEPDLTSRDAKLAAKAHQPLRFSNRSTAATGRLDSSAPSQLEGAGQISGAELFSASRDTAMEIGTLMHGWFELVDWIADDGELPSDEQLRRVGIEQAVKFDASWPARFRQMLGQPNISALLNEACYRDEMSGWLQRDIRRLRIELLNEHPIIHADGQRLLTGSIDRLVIVWDAETAVAADIIDYKTDKVADEAAARRRAEYYAPQLHAYRQAIASMLHLENDKLRTRLLFTQSDLLIEISPPVAGDFGPVQKRLF